MPRMKVGFIQSSPEFGKVRDNVERAIKALGRIASKGAVLVVLPELFSTGYQFRNRKEALRLAEEAPGGYTVGRLTWAARDLRLFIAAGMAERSGRRVYNSAVLVGPEGFVGVYRKAHLFSNEKKYFTPGDTAPRVYDIGRARVGMMVCFDWVFPEVARSLALKGADIICHPSNLVLPYCPEAMVTRCIENRVFSITANRVGVEERTGGKPLRFIGLSEIVAPDGNILCRASRSRAGAGVAEIDIREARDKRITPLNDLFKDRRTDLFSI